MLYRLNRGNLVLLVNPLQCLIGHFNSKHALLRIVIAIYAINILVIRGLQLGIYVNHLETERIHLLLVKYETQYPRRFCARLTDILVNPLKLLVDTHNTHILLNVRLVKLVAIPVYFAILENIRQLRYLYAVLNVNRIILRNINASVRKVPILVFQRINDARHIRFHIDNERRRLRLLGRRQNLLQSRDTRRSFYGSRCSRYVERIKRHLGTKFADCLGCDNPNHIPRLR